MSRKVNWKKRRIRILILAGGCLSILIIVFGFLSFLLSLLFRGNPEPEVKKEEKGVANTVKEYRKYKVDESGRIPVMMYHGIHSEVKSSETGNTGGNVDVDGYNRTAEAFEQDLEMYYKQGFQAIALKDYVNNHIDVDAGKSPIVFTFDDGRENNCKVFGKDKDGNLEIDPKSAVGIMEAFKKKHPDFHITATFFVNSSLFNQPEYNEEILKWLVDHGYDIGNHTKTHANLLETTLSETKEEVGYVYNQLESIIPGKYVNIVALPFGTPYQLDHENMQRVFSGSYKGKKYKTDCALQVSWEPNESPFSKDYIPNFYKRIRAYDNNGQEFDIESTFELLKSTKYISDGDPDTIVVPKDKKSTLDSKYKKKAKTYVQKS